MTIPNVGRNIGEGFGFCGCSGTTIGKPNSFRFFPCKEISTPIQIEIGVSFYITPLPFKVKV